MKAVNIADGYVYFVLIIITWFFAFFVNISDVAAQPEPPTMKKYVDDLELCRLVQTGDEAKVAVGLRQFCQLAKTKDINSDINFRNDLIEIVIGQIDDNYRDYKNGIRKKNNFFQTILDILEVGASTTIDFIKGERAKSVIAAGLTGLKGGRSAFNKNFEVRQLDVLINRMNTDRAEVLRRIIRNKSEPVEKYRWLQAKRDLRDYYESGSWGHALDSLISTTGAEADVAEKEVEKLNDLKTAAGVRLAPTVEEYKAAMSLDDSLYKIESAWEMAKTKKETADAAIVTANAKIAEANSKDPVNETEKVQWTDKKTAAEKDLSDAQTVIDANEERVKKIYDTAVADKEIKTLLDKIPVKFAARIESINPSQKNIDEKKGKFEDYILIFKFLNGITLDELSKNPTAIERLKNMIEASK